MRAGRCRFRAAIGIRRANPIGIRRANPSARTLRARQLGERRVVVVVGVVFGVGGVGVEIGIVVVVVAVVHGDHIRAGRARATRVRGGASADDGFAVPSARRAVRAAEPRVVASRRRFAHPETQRVRARRARLAPEHRLHRVHAVAHAARRHVRVRGGGERVGRAGEFPRIGKYGASFAFSAAEGFLFYGVDARGSRGEERLELRLGERAVVLAASVAVVGAALVAADGDGVFAHAAEVRRAVSAVHLLG